MQGHGTCADCGAVNVLVIGPIGLATCEPCRKAYAERLDRITPALDKVIGQYQRGLITPDEFASSVVEVTA